MANELKNTLEYKGYTGQFYYLEGDDNFHGVVLGTRDVIHFQGASTAELRRSLAEGVEDYLAWCEEEGRPPEKPYTGKLMLRLDPEMHRAISLKAQAEGVSLNTWIKETLAEKMKQS